MQKKNNNPVALRRRAEVQLKRQIGHLPLPQTEGDIKRALHELQVNQIELEIQNAELMEAREKVETLLETYTDLYDFAPVAYFSVDEQGLILEVNLIGAALLGLERSRLINRRLLDFVDPPSRGIFLAFFKKIFSSSAKQICEMSFMNKRSIPFWADLQAAAASSLRDKRKWCRLAVSDVTALKQAEETRQNLEGMAASNRELKQEVAQRRKAEVDLKRSEAHYAQLFEQSLHQQEQLRHLSRQLLLTQEEERKRISRELHDEVVQTLVGINVHLASLTVKSPFKLSDLKRNIARTQRLVEKSVTIVHRFARELRPTVLDDLGLIPALQSFIKDFATRTKLHIHFKAFPGVEQLSSTQRIVLYRVTQSALANVHKHAHASIVKIGIRKLGSAICLEIHDNGKSFDMKRVLFAKRHKRLGLLGSRERVEMVGGKFSIVSAPGFGTAIRAIIPVTDEEAKGRAKA